MEPSTGLGSQVAMEIRLGQQQSDICAQEVTRLGGETNLVDFLALHRPPTHCSLNSQGLRMRTSDRRCPSSSCARFQSMPTSRSNEGSDPTHQRTPSRKLSSPKDQTYFQVESTQRLKVLAMARSRRVSRSDAKVAMPTIRAISCQASHKQFMSTKRT